MKNRFPNVNVRDPAAAAVRREALDLLHLGALLGLLVLVGAARLALA